MAATAVVVTAVPVVGKLVAVTLVAVKAAVPAARLV